MSELRAVSADQPDHDSQHAFTSGGFGSSTEPALEGTWPHALSHEPMLRVSDVLGLVQSEFPALTTSKLRFLDNNGLVQPYRTGSGYRQYSPADVERLRFVLRQQRDHYRPLNVISGHLAALDTGKMRIAVEPRTVEGEEDQYLSVREFAASASVTIDLIQQLNTAGLLTESIPGKYDRSWLPLATAAQSYLTNGGDLRTLKSLTAAARRETDRAGAVAQPDKMRGRSGEAEATAREFGEASIAVFSACVRGNLDR